MTTQDILDKFAEASENERLNLACILEYLENEPFCRFDDWAESITEVAEAIGRAKEAVDEWTQAESREEKAELKEAALEALDELVQSWNSSMLDLREMKDWEPEDADV